MKPRRFLLASIIFLLPLLLWTLGPVGGSAQDQPPSVEEALDFTDQLPAVPFQNVRDVEQILRNIISWMFTIFMVLAVIFVIWAAFLYLTAAGNEEQIKKAKKQLVYAVVAIIVALMSGSVGAIVYEMLGGDSGGGGGVTGGTGLWGFWR